jgi:hypothetical protein
LTITPKQQHLGKIRQGETRPFTFTVTNTSNQTVEIKEFSASCGCTQVQLDRTTLRPGENGILSGLLSAQARLGQFVSTLAISFLDGRTLHVQLEANAVAVLQGPNYLDLGSTYPDDAPVAHAFTFKRGEDDLPWDELRLRVPTSGENLAPHAVVTRQGNSWTLTLTSPKPNEIGLYRKKLLLECWNTGTRGPTATFSVTAVWKIKSRQIEISPMTAYFGAVRLGEEKTVRLRVKHLSNGPLTLDKVEFPQGMEATAALISDTRDPYQFYLEIRAKSLPSCEGAISTVFSSDTTTINAKINLIGG